MEANGSLEILVVDDSEESRVLVRAFLKSTAHQLTQAEDGLRGLQLLQSKSFDLAFVDIEMPLMDGIEMVAQYRAWEAQQGRSEVYLVALTGHKDFMCEGFNRSLNKPIKKADLLEVINTWCSNRG